MDSEIDNPSLNQRHYWPGDKVSAPSSGHPGINPWLSHTSDLEIGTLMASMPDAWCYTVLGLVGWVSADCAWAT